MKIKYVIYALIAILLAYLIYNRLSADKKSNAYKAGGNSGANKISVNGVVAKAEDFADEVNVSGTIEANEQVEIRSEISGLIKSINFKEGSNVSKGQLLLKIDDSELQAQYAQALTKEKLAQETADRAGKLLKSEAISQEEYDNAAAELKSLQAQTQLIRAQLAKTSVRAPFSGRIGLRSVSNGAYVTPTQTIANLVSSNPVKISFSVPEKYSQMVGDGANVNFTVSGSSKIYTAKVYAKEPAVDINTRTLVIKALAPNANNELIPGTFANIQITLKAIKDAILIPSVAVIPVLNGKQVYVSENGLAKTVKIQSDVRTADRVLVSEGISVGDTIITSGIMALKEGAPVKVNVKTPAKD
ncbi:efflux RND transporter periplasmic adaptor subunit [Pelobium manganitolerans]|uniref:efflux RND transporter periplasmic adaptor subunit n=1 Tax=Pelobium manganitolerans TaxID=1842495 RepID=UPI003FA3C0B6